MPAPTTAEGHAAQRADRAGPGARRLPVPSRGGLETSTRWARKHWLLVAAIVVGLAARIVFWAATDRRIDDALITIKFDKNLADGVGLVHNLGDDRVQGFTSALSVLVPLPGELIASGGGLFLIRLVSLAAFVLAAVYAYRICRELDLALWPTGFALAFLALDQNQLFYSMVGLETQIAVAVLLAGIYYVLVEDYTKCGVALGLAPLARPDFVLWVAPAYLYLLLRSRPRALRAALISAAILAPWLIFTTVYYGSPVPNTIAAKSASFSPPLPGVTHPVAWFDFLRDRLHDHKGDWTTIAPFFENALVLKAPISRELARVIALVIVGLALVGGIATWRRRAWRPAIAFVVLFALYKVVFLTFGYFEWYGVPAIAILILLAAAGLDRITRLLAAALRGRVNVSAAQLAAVPVVCLAVAYAAHLPSTIRLQARTQHDIEDRVRVPLGQYLGRVIKPGQTLTSESSGYVGYYTNGTLYDWPGLESTTVVDTVRSAGVNWWKGSKLGPASPMVVAHLLNPDWLVLRPQEVQWLRERFPATAARYRQVRRFAVSDDDSRLRYGSVEQWNIDRDFIVLRRES
jgi:hypothetical protein